MSQKANNEALVLGTGEVIFSPDVKTVAAAQAAGFDDLGSTAKITLETDVEEQDAYTPNRGILKRSRTSVTKQDMTYKVTAQEMKRSNILLALSGANGTNFTQAALAADNGTPLAFGTTAAVIGRWYQLYAADGSEVRDLTTVTIATLTEGTDFVLDKKTGRIRFLTAQTADRTPVLTAPAITTGDAGNMKGFRPLDGKQMTGVAKIQVFDDNHANKLVYDSGFFLCNVSVANFGDFDGENFLDMELDFKLTEQLTDSMVAED